MRISDWSSDVCSSDQGSLGEGVDGPEADESAEHDHHEEADDAAPDEPFDGLVRARRRERLAAGVLAHEQTADVVADGAEDGRSEEHTSELQSLMRLSYAVFWLQKKT